MVPLHGIVSRIRAAAQHLATLFRSPARIGTPPSARPAWHDPVAHARDFGQRYAQDLDLVVAERMRELGIPDRQIGMPDRIEGIDWAAFHPHGTQGGNNSPDGRLIVDSGVLDLELLRKDYSSHATAVFGKARLRDRLDAITRMSTRSIVTARTTRRL